MSEVELNFETVYLRKKLAEVEAITDNTKTLANALVEIERLKQKLEAEGEVIEQLVAELRATRIQRSLLRRELEVAEKAINAAREQKPDSLIGTNLYGDKFRLDLESSDDAIKATRLHIQTQGKDESDESIFGIYKSKCVSTMKENVNATSFGLDLTFREPIMFTPKSDSLESLQDNTDLKENEIKRLRQFWGNKFEIEDYEWLEFELSKWKAAKKLERNEESLLQQIETNTSD